MKTPYTASRMVVRNGSWREVLTENLTSAERECFRLRDTVADLLSALKAWKELRDSDGADGRDAVEWIERVERQMNDAILKAEGVTS